MGERPDIDLDPTLGVGDAPTLASDSARGGPDASNAGAALAPGARLGRYRLGHRLGAGAMGVVWAARDPNLDRPVAIKVVHPEFARAPDAAARLLREARAMAKVSHPGVVAVHDAGQAGDQLFLAMELVPGTTLGKLMRERSAAELTDWRRWLGMMIDAGRGLAAAHAAGIVHRDFKPDNVLVSDGGRVCVGDFGVAELSLVPRAGADLAPSASVDNLSVADLTMTGALLGTPAYMSPEQLRGEDADARADQFAFCASAFEAIYGVRPFALPTRADPSPVATLIQTIEAGQLEPVSRTVPRAIHDAIVRGLAPAAAARWPSMDALLAALARPRRRWVAPIAIGAIAAAALAIGAIAIRGGDRARATPAPPATAPATARPLYPVPMRPSIALSPDGARVAIVSTDRVVVRGVDGGLWQFDHLDGNTVSVVEFADADHLRIALVNAGAVVTWTVSTDAIGARQPVPAGWVWQGTVADGWLLGHVVGRGYELAVAPVDGGAPPRVIARIDGRLEVVAIAPDRRRIAYVEPDGGSGRIVIVDVASDATIRGEAIVELSGVTWRDGDHLWLTTGTTTRPAIYELAVTGDRLAAPIKRYEQERGWFGPIVSVPGRTVFVDSANAFRAKLVSRAGIVQDLDPELVGAGFGWLGDGRWLGWNRAGGALVPSDDRPAERIRAGIDGEPGNATRADDIVILAMRKPGGREVVAVSLTTSKRVWSAPVGALGFVRCAGDRQPPCVASAPRDGGPARLVRIDPTTGALGDEVAQAAELQDAAVAPDGVDVLISDGTPILRAITLATGASRAIKVAMSNTRGLAYDERGGFYVAGTAAPVKYEVLHVVGDQATVLVQSDNEILFLPRPARDGHATLVMGRLFMPSLKELVAP